MNFELSMWDTLFTVASICRSHVNDITGRIKAVVYLNTLFGI